MTQKEFNKLTFSQRYEISKGTLCKASWQVQQVGGDAAYFISCRECSTMLQSDCTPKCLLNHTPLTDANTVLCKPASGGAVGAAVASEGNEKSVSVDGCSHDPIEDSAGFYYCSRCRTLL
jgi:hypothetical protein